MSVVTAVTSAALAIVQKTSAVVAARSVWGWRVCNSSRGLGINLVETGVID